MTKNASKTSSEKPLLGAQLCCTSIPPEIRTELAEWAQEMGADHTLDLTSDVTHLLVGGTDSKKYQYVAREREDVKVLQSQFVGAVRELWMNDQPIDLNALEAEYRCPTLFGLKISITGFEDINFRNELARNIVKNGGEYSGDLTKDVTHLIAFTPDGKKYEYATAWGLKVVSIKWYKDTLDRGMQLEEARYHPAMLPEHQGVGAWNRHPLGSPKLGKRLRDELSEEKTFRKLRRTASARFGSQQNDMWNDIVGLAVSESSDTIDSRLRICKSMSHIQQKVAENRSSEATHHRDIHDLTHESSTTNKPPPNPMTNTTGNGVSTFGGKHFTTKGFDERRRAILYEHIVGHGGILHPKLSELQAIAATLPESCILIVPHQIESSQLAVLERSRLQVAIVTELWLEHCISVKSYISPDEYILGQPTVSINVPTISTLVVNASGFSQVQTLHISKIVKKLGARYEEKFTANTSVLICSSSNINHQKVEFASAWRIPAVSERWLWQMIRTNRKPAFEPFLLPCSENVKAGRRSSNGVSSRPVQSAGTTTSTLQEANDVEGTFQGIANNARSPQETVLLSDGFMQDVRPNTEKAVRGATGKLQEHRSRSKVDRGGSTERQTPLQEIAPNVQNRKPSPPKSKKKLFQSYDGNSSDCGEPATTEFQKVKDGGDGVAPDCEDSTRLVQHQTSQGVMPVPEAKLKSHSNAINEFFEVKAAAEARASAEASKRPSSRASNKKLLGRAMSNLSNSSRTSNDHQIEKRKQPLSRASSINSINTDGLGMPLSMMSRVPSDLQVKNNTSTAQTAGESLLRGNMSLMRPTAKSAPEQMSTVEGENASKDDPGRMTKLDFHAALTALSTSQIPQPPSPSQQAQLSYADSNEAMALKAHLAQKRRNRAKTGEKDAEFGPELNREESEEKIQRLWREQQETNAVERHIHDDEAVVGGGRRTRGRERALSKMLRGEQSEDSGLPELGDLF